MIAAPAIGFEATCDDDVESFLAHWATLQSRSCTPFQTAGWLRSWYLSLGRKPGNSPLCMIVKHAGQTVMLMPLVATRRGGLSVVRFADEGVTDYNAPLLGDLESLGEADGAALWSAVRGALSGHDVLLVDKMLTVQGDQPNPLALAWRAQPCEMFGNYMIVDEDLDAWRFKLAKEVRKEFERTWRVFSRDANACFERVTDPAQALVLFSELETQQRARMAHAGDLYVLDGAPWHALYEDRLRSGLADGSVVLTALRCGTELVAALYGISDGERYVALRITHAGEAWKHCAPGKLLLERTVRHLHGQGIRYIDFAIGDYFHKRVFGVSHTPLLDACVALSVRGVPRVLAWRTKRWIKRQGWLIDLIRKARSRR
jgi:CelD/BcsL family acetyltransferase involved in cellulose biosynthesis